MTMRPDLLQLVSKNDPSWIFRVGFLFSDQLERWSQLRSSPAYAELRGLGQEAASQAGSLSPEAQRAGIEKILMSDGAPAGLQWLEDSGGLAAVLPELHATVDFSQEAGRKHKDVWEHTKVVVIQAAPRPAVRWAALLHDIGKVKTRTFTADGKVHFHRHSEVGARMFEDIGRRFQFDREAHRTLRFLILHHLRPNQYVPSWTDSAVRRFEKEVGPYLPDLLDLSRADITSRRPGKRQQALVNIDALAGRIAHIKAEDAVLPLLPSGIGDVIMERFRLPPSRFIGDLKRALEAAIGAGELEPRMDPSYYLPHVEKLLAEAPKELCVCQE
jgi:poly(A) polymerase